MMAPLDVTGTEARVCADIARRQQHGLAKYGVSVEANPLQLRAWLQHVYEEHLDAAIYLRRAIEEIDRAASDEQSALVSSAGSRPKQEEQT